MARGPFSGYLEDLHNGVETVAGEASEVETAMSNMIGFVETPVDRFDTPQEAVSFVDALSAKRPITVDGTLTVSTPVEYDNSRNDTWKGPTGLSNINDGGSRIVYNGVGKEFTIASATNANPAVFTVSGGHTLVNDERTFVFSAAGGTWDAAIDNGPWFVADVTATTFTLKDSSGAYLNGTSLGTLTSAVIRNIAAIAAFLLTGNFTQSYEGITWSATSTPEALVWIGANDYFNTTDLSGTLTHFRGNQFRLTSELGDSAVVVENHKEAIFDRCWFVTDDITPVTNKQVLRVGTIRSKSRRTLLEGAAYNLAVNDAFVLGGQIALHQAIGFSLKNSQLDANSAPAAVTMPSGGLATSVQIENVLATNEGGATASGIPAVYQGFADQSGSNVLPYTSGWDISGLNEFDYAVGLQLEAGMASVRANTFRGRVSGNVGIILGEKARQERIDPTNDFTQMTRAGNIGIVDRRYKQLTITNITQANPAVVTFASGQDLGVNGKHFENGDRIRITGVVGMTEVNNKEFIVQNATTTTVQLYTTDDAGATSSTLNSTAYTAYSSGGVAVRPYMWHRQSVGGTLLSLGHSHTVFDLALDQSATLSAATVNLLNMFNVPIIGGHYEVSYNVPVAMNSVSGDVKFNMSIGGTTYFESAFSRSSATTDQVHHQFTDEIYIPGISATSGSTLRFRVISPGSIIIRGKSATTLGHAKCRLRRLG